MVNAAIWKLSITWNQSIFVGYGSQITVARLITLRSLSYTEAISHTILQIFKNNYNMFHGWFKIPNLPSRYLNAVAISFQIIYSVSSRSPNRVCLPYLHDDLSCTVGEGGAEWVTVLRRLTRDHHGLRGVEDRGEVIVLHEYRLFRRLPYSRNSVLIAFNTTHNIQELNTGTISLPYRISRVRSTVIHQWNNLLSPTLTAL